MDRYGIWEEPMLSSGNDWVFWATMFVAALMVLKIWADQK